MIVKIPKIKLSDAKQRLDMLVNKAKKLNLNAQYEVVGEGNASFPHIDIDGKLTHVDLDCVSVRMTTDKVALSGYEFVAKIEHVTETDIVVLSHETLDRTKFHQSNCNHCNTNRRRKTTFVVRNTQTGQLMQVGSSCVNDFLGDGTLAAAVRNFLYLKSVEDSLEELKESFRTSRYFSVEDVLACSLFVSNNGTRYVKRYEDMFSTAEEVAGCIHKWLTGGLSKDTDTYKAKAKEILANIQKDVTDSEYMLNLKSVLAGGHVELNTGGYRILVSACVLARPKEVELIKTHFGTEKERFRKVPVTFIKGIYLGEGDFGPKMLYLLNYDGYELTWFTGNTNIEVGETANVSFTIKEHSYYKNIPQTRITRLTVH